MKKLNIPGYYVTHTEIVLELGEEHCSSHDVGYFENRASAEQFAEDYVDRILEYGYPSFFGNSTLIFTSEWYYEISDETLTRIIRVDVEHRSMVNGHLEPTNGYRIMKVYCENGAILDEIEVGYAQSSDKALRMSRQLANKTMCRQPSIDLDADENDEDICFFGPYRNLFVNKDNPTTVFDSNSTRSVYFEPVIDGEIE